jgi:hypothetical protein
MDETAVTTDEILDGVVQKHPLKSQTVKLEWFLWPQFSSKRTGNQYPPAYTPSPATRGCHVLVEGAIPAALADSDFLRWHVRQFIWVRGQTNGESRLSVHRVKDGLKEGLRTELADLHPATMTWRQLGEALDRAWFTYMKDRPLTARGYLDNPYGKWMRRQANQMLTEDDEIRVRAIAGTLLPPGRKVGEAAPYLSKASASR